MSARARVCGGDYSAPALVANPPPPDWSLRAGLRVVSGSEEGQVDVDKTLKKVVATVRSLFRQPFFFKSFQTAEDHVSSNSGTSERDQWASWTGRGLDFRLVDIAINSPRRIHRRQDGKGKT
jgi:hypothetical protein